MPEPIFALPLYPVFFDLAGKPLDAGYIYIGEQGQNPEAIPAQVYWDATMTQPAAQPIRTIAGYPSRNGSQAAIYTAGDYSITVRDKGRVLVYTALTGVNIAAAATAEAQEAADFCRSLAFQQAFSFDTVAGQQFYPLAFNPGQQLLLLDKNGNMQTPVNDYTIAAVSGVVGVQFVDDVLYSGDRITYRLSRAIEYDPNLNRVEGFHSRADLVAHIAANGAVDGQTYIAGGLSYVGSTGATDIPDLPGLLPADEWTVDHFGADNTGGGDDTAAFQAAFDYVASTGGGVVEGGAGKTYSCGQINAVPGVSFFGNGCTIVNTSASFLVYSGGAYNAHTQIEGFTLRPQLAPSVGSRGVWFDGGSFSGKKKVSISDIHIPRLNAITFNTVGYENCIQITNGFYPSVNNCIIAGTYNPASNPAGQYVDTGILFDQQTVGGEIVHCLVGAIHTGIKAPTLSQEGVQLRSCEVVGVRIGYDLGAAVFGGPGMWLTSCHANASLTCFNLSNRTDVSLVGCTAYRQNTFFEEVWIGYDLSGAYDVRMSNLNALNNLLSGSLDNIAIRLLDTIAVTGSNIVFRQPKRAIVHQGGCSDCHFDNISFLGSGSYADTAYETASSDDKLTLGAHTLRGTWTNPYVIAQRKDAIVIEFGRTKYVRVAETTSSAAETRLLTVGATPQHWRIGLAAGAGAYDYNVDLNTAGAQIGDFFDFYFNMPSAADRRVIIRNGSGGSTLATVATASSKRYGCRAVFDGTNWDIAWLNESVFI